MNTKRQNQRTNVQTYKRTNQVLFHENKIFSFKEKKFLLLIFPLKRPTKQML